MRPTANGTPCERRQGHHDGSHRECGARSHRLGHPRAGRWTTDLADPNEGDPRQHGDTSVEASSHRGRPVLGERDAQTDPNPVNPSANATAHQVGAAAVAAEPSAMAANARPTIRGPPTVARSRPIWIAANTIPT